MRRAVGISFFVIMVSLNHRVLAAEPRRSMCAARIVRIPRRGVAPAYSINVRLQNFRYRITVALQVPSAQNSGLLIQVFWEQGLRDRDLETYLLRHIRKVFGSPNVTDMGQFLRILVPESVDREDFEESVKKFEADLKVRFSSTAMIFPSISPASRARSADVAEAARMMAGLLRRNRVVSSIDKADRILNVAHNRLISGLTEGELRFFDYALFDEVIPYEKDLKMQEIAQRGAGELDPNDLDYPAIHASIRSKFISISKDMIEKQRTQALPHIQEIGSHLKGVRDLGQRIIDEFPHRPFRSFVEDVLGTPKTEFPFSREGFAEFVKLMSRKEISVDDVAEFSEALNLVNYRNVSEKPFSEELNRDIGRFSYHMSRALTTLKFLAIELEQQRSNEPAEESVGDHLFVGVRKVLPGNGSPTDSSFIGAESNMPDSFVNRPHRLNSGTGNRKERFDYDTPEFD